MDDFRARKRRRERITALTAYDYPTARLLDESGIDIRLGQKNVRRNGTQILDPTLSLDHQSENSIVFTPRGRRKTSRDFLL